MADRSQVSCVGEAAPKSWDDYERGCLFTFNDGNGTPGEDAAFRGGMRTVFNLLRDEFPPAEQCKAAPALQRALQAFVDYYEQAGIGPCDEDHEDDGTDQFDGDTQFNVRQGRAALALLKD